MAGGELHHPKSAWDWESPKETEVLHKEVTEILPRSLQRTSPLGSRFPAAIGALSIPQQFRDWTLPQLIDEDALLEHVLDEMQWISLEDDFIVKIRSEPKPVREGISYFVGDFRLRGEEQAMLKPQTDPESPDVTRYVIQIETPMREDEDLFDVTEEYSKKLTQSLEEAEAGEWRSKMYVKVVPSNADR